MDDDRYLWDRSGDPDPEVAALEALLAPLAHSGRPIQFELRPRPAWTPWFAAVAAAVLAFTLTFTLKSAPGVLLAEHHPRLVPLRILATHESLSTGAWFTAASDRRELMLGDLGHMVLEPGTRLQVHRLDVNEARIFLERGSLVASVSGAAHPRFFQVLTPSTTCVDLGCKYSLRVDEQGDTVVTVIAGKVAFEHLGREHYVPAQATCLASCTHGTTTPRFQDARPELVSALDAYDRSMQACPEVRLKHAHAVLAQVREPRDYLPAWHLLQDDEPRIVHAARRHLAVVAGKPERVLDAGQPGPVERQLWKDHLASLWRERGAH